MPCPFPLNGQYDSLDRAIELVQNPQPVYGYNWNNAKQDSYSESIIIEDEPKSQLLQDDADADDDDDDEWTTFRSIIFEQLPRFCFFHLNRFTYNNNYYGDDRKKLVNATIEIPLTLNITTTTTTTTSTTTTTTTTGIVEEELPQGDPTTTTKITNLQLLGGILHVCENGVIEEEGHYVTLLRNNTTDDDDNDSNNDDDNNNNNNNHNNSSWTLLDDESCTLIETEYTALQMLSGMTDDDTGNYFCATLVVYGKYNTNNNNNNNNNRSSETIVDDDDDDAKKISALVQTIQNQTPEDLIGKRLRVKWAAAKYYEGIVQSYNPIHGKHVILYDDGDEREYDLSKKTIEWI
eukprot:scaffold10514_cov72-Cylindrotheca_fusiformis.AAC.4